MSRALPLPVVQPTLTKQCTECAKCCTYVAAGIEGPNTVKDAGHMLWYLYHPGVSVYHDGHGDWSVIFASRCNHLREDRLCGIYENRPPICRDFDNLTCDVNDPGNGFEFFAPGEFLLWLAREKPQIYRRFREHYVPEALMPPPTALPPRLRNRR